MNNYENIHAVTSSTNCSICLSKNPLTYLTEGNSLFKVFTSIVKLQPKHDFGSVALCTSCIQELEAISQFIGVNNVWETSGNNGICCKVCLSKENLSLLSQNLLIVFQNLTTTHTLQDCRLCKECLDQLQGIFNFVTMCENTQRNVPQNLVIKQEPLETLLKEDPPDDEFIESPKKIKDETSMFSYDDFEMNSNYILKTEPLDIIDYNLEKYKDLLKVEVEQEGVQTDCKVMTKPNCQFRKQSFTTAGFLLYRIKRGYGHKNYTARCTKSWKQLLKNNFKPFKCQVCLKDFSTIQKKKQHQQNHFGKSCVVCSVCGRFFIKEREYLKHVRVHLTKQPLLKCGLCPTKFTKKILLLMHLRKHTNESKCYKCKICSISFHRKLLFKTHTEREKISCPYCPKLSCNMKQLSVHLQIHTREKAFECAVCSRKFSYKGNLIKHSRIHTGYKPYSCRYCSKNFSRSDYLAKHYLTIHRDDCNSQHVIKKHKISPTFHEKKNLEVTCNICSKNYPTKQSLYTHMRVHNKEKKFQCEVCFKTFSYKGLLTGHMKIHQDYRPFVCTLCPKSFIKRNDLTRHTYTHTKEKNYRCEICYEKFSRSDVLRLHLRGHTGQKPYKCHNCQKSFVQKSNLTHHRKRCTSPLEVKVDCYEEF